MPTGGGQGKDGKQAAGTCELQRTETWVHGQKNLHSSPSSATNYVILGMSLPLPSFLGL